ncbi:MAG TPA: hypothetical protein PLZ36_11395 [Armatimonadota bacterium]|nr:hypothetical protein [Armatimonadota bacterium]
MKRIIKKELDQELRARGLPEFARELAARYGYDPMQRKLARNPDEQALIDEIRGQIRHSGPASA